MSRDRCSGGQLGAVLDWSVTEPVLRQVAAAAASITSAKVAISAAPLTALPSTVPPITPGSAAAVNVAACDQHTRPPRAWPIPPASAPAVTATSEIVVASCGLSPSR